MFTCKERILDVFEYLFRYLSSDSICKLNSLSPIHLVKLRHSNFLGNEFLVKMYKL